MVDLTSPPGAAGNASLAGAAAAAATAVLPGVDNSDEVLASASILLQLSMLAVAFLCGHVLRRTKFYYFHEASAALVIGLLCGTVANLSSREEHFRQWLNFKDEFFFFFLLPPIIFESGFSLQPKPFFSNFGAICVLAVLGTLVASFVTGILVFMGGVLHIMYKLPFLESLMFGALISATDPVTVLAIFQELGADTDLYALVFGESVLNDAVAIVLYRTVLAYKNHPLANMSLMRALQLFVVVFVGSICVGVLVALICALLFKYARLAVQGLHHLECALILLFPYLAYMLADSVSLSGIVAMLFCGVLMKHYAFVNLSERAQLVSSSFFQVMASLAETFVFIYMGVAIAIERQSWSHVGFILCSTLFIVAARVANVVPCVHLINFFRPPHRRIPESHVKALCFSGLRGAMAFALALQAAHDLPDGHGRTIFTTTTSIVVLTVIVIGGSTATMLNRLELVGDRPDRLEIKDDSSSDESTTTRGGASGRDEEQPQHGAPQSRRQRMAASKSLTFIEIDQKYLRPFFTAPHSAPGSPEKSPLVKGPR